MKDKQSAGEKGGVKKESPLIGFYFYSKDIAGINDNFHSDYYRALVKYNPNLAKKIKGIEDKELKKLCKE